jgi:pilus assembly protein CpaE
MRVLLGMKQGEMLSALQSSYLIGNTLTAVHDRRSLQHAVESAYDLILIHVELFAESYPWEWVGALRRDQPGAKIVVIPDDTAYDSLWLEVLYRLAEEYRIQLAPIHTDPGKMFPITQPSDSQPTEGKGIIAAIWPAACKDGATTVAINTALVLAQQTKLKIGLLDLNLKNPEIGASLNLAAKGRSNAALRSKLQTGSLRPDDLMEACIPYRKAPQLRILAGSHRRDTAADFTAEMMQHLLDVCRSSFDITIVDVSAFPDNAATVCAAKYADCRWLVAQQAFGSHRWSWNEWYECYWKFAGLHPSQISLVVNRFSPHGEGPHRIADSLGMRLAGVLPNVPSGAGLAAMQEGTPLCEMAGAEAFLESIHSLASELSTAAGAAPLPLPRGKRRNGILSVLSALFS